MVDFSIEDFVSSALAEQTDVPRDLLWDPDTVLQNSTFKQEVDNSVPSQKSAWNAALKASGIDGALKLFGGLGDGGDTMTSGIQQMQMSAFKDSQEDDDDMLLDLYSTLIEDGTVWQPDKANNSTPSMHTGEETIGQLTNSFAPIHRFTTVNAVRVQSVSATSVAGPVHHGSTFHRFGASRSLPPEPILNRTPNFGTLNSSMAQSLAAVSGVAANQKSGKLVKELSKREVSRLWKNEEVSWQGSHGKEVTINGVMNAAAASQYSTEEEDEEDEEDFGQADMFADYKPSKLNIGVKHPDSVVETSSMSSVLPPDVWYQLKLPSEAIKGGALSALQLEAVVYASQQHWRWLDDGTRAGFLIGDGAGVGKGRTIAGIIYENYLQGRKKAVWFSVSNDLKYDSMRDLRDVGAGKIEVYSLNKFKYGKISGKANNSIKKGVVFATYPSLIGESATQETKYNTRLKQLLHWCGDDYEGVVVFDECHKAKNLFPVGSSKPTKTALAVMELQQKLPKARVIYSSATGASEPRNMGYMSRLGIWGMGTQFPVFNDFIQAVEKRGVGAMEMVAMDMKLRGMYLARQLSFSGVTFRIEEVPLHEKIVKAYDGAVRLWVDAREKFHQALNLLNIDKKERKMVWGQFWSAHQRFFKYMCIAAKVDEAVRLAKRALSDGKCVVIGLQSTGEARLMEQIEDSGTELNDFVSTAKGVLQTLITKHFPAPSQQSIAGLSGEVFFTYQPGGTSNNRKRKRGPVAGIKAPNAKRIAAVPEGSASSNGSDSSGSESPMKPVAKDAMRQDEDNNVGSADDDENSDSSFDEMEDFNPFATIDGEGEDPWLSREVHRSKKIKKKKEKTENNSTSLENVLSSAGLKVKQFGMLSKSSSPVISPSPTDPSVTKLKSMSTLSPSPGNFTEAQRSVSSLVGRSFRVEKEPAVRVIQMKEELLEEIEELSEKLPANTLDELINELGGPDKVCEMTGRKGRMVSMPDGTVRYESRSRGDVPLEVLNVFEKDRFMKGEKLIAIISEAASSGISLQADKRVLNQRRRLHITLELPWSADRAIQQFGRTHRSNQTSAPEYVFLISELAGEQRFASIVAKRLESLGALTHGDRRATESRDFSRYNFDTKYGRFALENTLKAVLGQMCPMVSPPSSYKGEFFSDVKTALIGVGLVVQELSYFSLQDSKDLNNITRFLNRILGITVSLQNYLFGYFTDTLAAVIQQAKKTGKFDEGILDVGSSGENVHRQSSEVFEGNSSGIAMTELHKVSVERGLSWEEALQLLYNDKQPQDGFYVNKQERTSRLTAILVKVVPTPYTVVRATVYKPNLGKQVKKDKLEDIEKKYKKVADQSAKSLWEAQYTASLSLCTHAFLRGQCKTVVVGQKCEFGRRQRTYHVLSGSVLSVWNQVESVLATQSKRQSRIQVVRLRTSDGGRIVGVLVPEGCVDQMRQMLTQLSAKSLVHVH